MGSRIVANNYDVAKYKQNTISTLLNGRDKITKEELLSKVLSNFNISDKVMANLNSIETLDGNEGFTNIELQTFFELAERVENEKGEIFVHDAKMDKHPDNLDATIEKMTNYVYRMADCSTPPNEGFWSLAVVKLDEIKQIFEKYTNAWNNSQN